MSKAILVIDLPKGTKAEDFTADLILKQNCTGTNFRFFEDEIELKPMPKQNTFTYESNDYQKGYVIGYNTCLDEILGEENDS